MFYVTVKNQVWKIVFRHIRGNVSSHEGTQCFIQGYRFDEASLRTVPIDTPPIFGKSNCNPIDQFCKEKGRKLSLKRALKLGKFTRASRANIWMAYFESRGINSNGSK